MYYINQISKNDCGYSCLKMLLATLNKNEEYLYLLDDYKEDAYSLLELISIAKKYDVNLEGYVIEDFPHFIKKDAKFPFVFVLEEENRSHMLLVKGKRGKKIHVYDPDFGSYWLRIDRFNNHPQVILKVESFKPHPIKKTKPQFLLKREKILLATLRIICVLLWFTSMYFMSSKFPFVIPLFLIILTVLLEIGYRLYSMIVFRNIDDRVLTFQEVKPENYYEFIRYCNKYKSYAINNCSSFYFSLMMVIFIVTIGILNDILNVIPFLFTLMLCFMHEMFFSNREKLDSYRLERKEKSIELSKDFKEFRTSYGKLVDNALTNSYRNNLHLVIAGFVILVAILINMYLKGINDVSYVIFYLFGNIYIYSEIIKLLNHGIMKRKENETLYKVLSLA